jgi:hypothetical protein
MGSSTVALVFQVEGEYRPFCTGVWVEDKKILTANHCINAVAKAIAQKESGDEEALVPDDTVGTPIHYILENEVQAVGQEPYAIHLGKAVKVDEDHDLALVEALGPVPSHDVAKLVSTSPAIGEKLHFVGHVRGLYWTYVDGIVAAYREDLVHKGPIMQVSAPVYFGNSGGGAFTESGELCGIASYLMPAPITAGYIHAESIRKFLMPSDDVKAPFRGKIINKE